MAGKDFTSGRTIDMTNLHACDDTADLLGKVFKYLPNSKATDTNSEVGVTCLCSAVGSMSGATRISSAERKSPEVD